MLAYFQNFGSTGFSYNELDKANQNRDKVRRRKFAVSWKSFGD